jgi:hypothetical protein
MLFIAVEIINNFEALCVPMQSPPSTSYKNPHKVALPVHQWKTYRRVCPEGKERTHVELSPIYLWWTAGLILPQSTRRNSTCYDLTPPSNMGLRLGTAIYVSLLLPFSSGASVAIYLRFTNLLQASFVDKESAQSHSWTTT